MSISRAKQHGFLSAKWVLFLTVLYFAPTPAVLAQTSAQPKPTPTPRRPLPKPVAGSRGFEQFAKRDASARLIAVAGTRVIGTRVIIDPGDFYSKGEANYKAGKYEAAAKDLTQA